MRALRRLVWLLCSGGLMSCSWGLQFFGPQGDTGPQEEPTGSEGGAPAGGGSGDSETGGAEPSSAGAENGGGQGPCSGDPYRQWFQDADGDGYGTEAVTELACEAPPGFVGLSGDCADRAEQDPNCGNQSGEACSPEYAGLDGCDDVDTDCDGLFDEDCFPDPLPVMDGLLLWLDGADVETFEPSGPVGLWRDKSGQDRHAEQADPAKRPSHVVGGWNGLGVLRFDGVDDSLTIDNTLGDFDTVNLSVLLVVVPILAREPNQTSTPFSVRGTGLAETRITLHLSGDLSGFFTHDGVQAVRSEVPLEEGSASLLGFSFQGTSAEEHYLNGQLISAHLHGPNDSNLLRPVTLGAAEDGVDHLSGDLAELMVFGRTLLPMERAALHSYFENKWGL